MLNLEARDMVFNPANFWHLFLQDFGAEKFSQHLFIDVGLLPPLVQNSDGVVEGYFDILFILVGEVEAWNYFRHNFIWFFFMSDEGYELI